MTSFSQDTDSETNGSSFPRQGRPFAMSDVTTGMGDQTGPFSVRRERDPVRQARSIVSQVEDPAVARQVESLLSTIHSILERVQEEKGDLSHIPPIHAYVADDGSVLIEWIFPDFRVGFNIEPNPADSGWHLVSNKNLEEKTESGQLTSMSDVIALFLESILPNI